MHMRNLLSLLAITLLASAAALAEESASAKPKARHNQLTPEQIAEGWISLFDGQTLFGWRPANYADWSVRNEAIQVGYNQPGWLMTTSEFADFHLHVEFLAAPTAASGILLRGAYPPTENSSEPYVLSIAPPESDYPTGSLLGRKKTDLSDELASQLHPWDGNWHAYDVLVSGNRIVVQLDGKQILDFTDPEPTALRGRIGLEFLKSEMSFRNIRLKPLSMKPIFNGKTLAGWNTKRAEESEFKVTDNGDLHVLNGRGQLESDKSYGDFILQLDCRVDGDSLNSGVFFRCIPGEFTNGYECQIHNGMQDGDPTKPQDCGTGGFYRRQDARQIVAKDHEWFTMTLAANGPHMAAWVNGYQVSDWTDARQPDENPRKGLRLKPGTLAIQGHDPTTDLRFRRIRIVELPAEAQEE